MSNILTKIHDDITELNNIRDEYNKQRKAFFEHYGKLQGHENNIEIDSALQRVAEMAASGVKGDDFACIEAAETYDLIERLFMEDGLRLVEDNKTFSDAIVNALNSIYTKGFDVVNKNSKSYE